jgi:hypothetical protein
VAAGDNGPATLAQICSPEGLAVDPSGVVYVASAGMRWVSVGWVVVSSRKACGLPRLPMKHSASVTVTQVFAYSTVQLFEQRRHFWSEPYWAVNCNVHSSATCCAGAGLDVDWAPGLALGRLGPLGSL